MNSVGIQQADGAQDLAVLLLDRADQGVERVGQRRAIRDYLEHVALPSKEACYGQMESMIYHFKLIMDGIQVPPGERYGMVEGGNGELGYYCISDGGGKPYRIKVRPPCFPIFSTFSKLVDGHTISDAIATLGGLNVIAGELER